MPLLVLAINCAAYYIDSSIKRRADALANLPSRARWIPKGDAAGRQRNGSRELSALLGKPMEGLFMSRHKLATDGSSELTSAGVRWSEVPEAPCPYTEWLDGRHGPAQEALPSVDQVPIPKVLSSLPVLHPDRPRGSKPMADVHGARQRLANCRPGAWVISPFTGWRWAKWPNGEVGWLPANTMLPDCLRVRPRNDVQ